MADTLRIKRRAAGGAAGAPSSLAAAELAYNEQDDILYYGKGNSSGNATSILAIAGPGAFAAVGGGGATLSSPCGRLTLTSGSPISSSVTAQTTLYYSPYTGNQVPIYNGTAFTMTTFAELSATASDTTKSPAAMGANQCLDWFVWSDAGTMRLGHGPAWTSLTARSAGTALVRVGGIWLNNAAITNGPAASRGTYVGTTRSNATSTFDFYNGFANAAALLNVWNCYNRVEVMAQVNESAATWTYALTAWRAVNAKNTNRITTVVGLDEEPLQIMVFGSMSSGSAEGYNGVALDVTNAIVANSVTGYGQINGNGIMAYHKYYPGIGSHFYQALEGTSGATVNFFGGSTNCCIIASMRM